MKQLSGSAEMRVPAPLEQCLELLADVEGYPRWYPEVVREVRVLERAPDGRALRAETMLRVSHGPLARDLDLLLAVGVHEPDSVVLTRVPHGSPDGEAFQVSWLLSREGQGTTIRLRLEATLSLPRLLPLGDIADTIAGGFVAAAVAALTPPGS